VVAWAKTDAAAEAKRRKKTAARAGNPMATAV
jgi:hypothetical protein